MRVATINHLDSLDLIKFSKTGQRVKVKQFLWPVGRLKVKSSRVLGALGEISGCVMVMRFLTISTIW